jgi:hypothetical protein
MRALVGALRASAAGAGGCAWSRWPTAGPLTVLSARIRRARPCRGRSPACLVFSGRWPMEGEAVTRGRGPGARGGDGRWPARGALSPGGPPAAARRRPTAVFVRGATARAEPVRRGESRPSRRSSSAAGVRTSRGGDDTSDSKTLPETIRNEPHPRTFRTLVDLDYRDTRRLDCRDAPPPRMLWRVTCASATLMCLCLGFCLLYAVERLLARVRHLAWAFAVPKCVRGAYETLGPRTHKYMPTRLYNARARA